MPEIRVPHSPIRIQMLVLSIEIDAVIQIDPQGGSPPSLHLPVFANAVLAYQIMR